MIDPIKAETLQFLNDRRQLLLNSAANDIKILVGDEKFSILDTRISSTLRHLLICQTERQERRVHKGHRIPPNNGGLRCLRYRVLDTLYELDTKTITICTSIAAAIGAIVGVLAVFLAR